jgi:hypothetical protein
MTPKGKWYQYVNMSEGLGEKDEQLDKTLNKNNIKTSVLQKVKKKMQGTEETENCTIIYNGVSRQ